MSNIVIPLLQFLKTGDIIALQADSGTGLYLSRINHGGDGGTNPIEAAKSTIDVYSQFRVTVFANSQIALQADSGLYLSRINRGSTNPIEAAKSTIDVYSQFTITAFDDGIIALRADSGLYLSRINHGGDGGTNPIEAAKSTIDVYSQFRIIRLKG